GSGAQIVAVKGLIDSPWNQGDPGSCCIVEDICIPNQKLKVLAVQNQAVIQLQGIQNTQPVRNHLIGPGGSRTDLFPIKKAKGGDASGLFTDPDGLGTEIEGGDIQGGSRIQIEGAFFHSDLGKPLGIKIEGLLPNWTGIEDIQPVQYRLSGQGQGKFL